MFKNRYICDVSKKIKESSKIHTFVSWKQDVLNVYFLKRSQLNFNKGIFKLDKLFSSWN